MYLPRPILDLVGNAPYTCDDIGKSGSTVLCYGQMVLKIEPKNEKFQQSVEMLRWLEGKLPAPKVLCALTEGDFQYLLMSRVPGKMACDPEYTKDPEHLAELLADALNMLWSVDISGCPFTWTLEQDLAEARKRVQLGLVDTEDVQPDTFGPGGFRDPEALLQWLEENAPPMEPVFSHGDLCLPNVFFQEGKVSGFIDLGDCGISDKWRDIALCWRSLLNNISGVYATDPVPDFDPDILFEKLGMEADREKLRYYILLDELF